MLGSLARRPFHALSVLLAVSLGILGSSPATANTWWVDDDGGAGIDFNDIQVAIDAATDGDTIFVYPETYSAFFLGKSLTIVSTPVVPRATVTGLVRISNVSGGRRAVVSGLAARWVSVANVSVPVVLDSLQVGHGSRYDPGDRGGQLSVLPPELAAHRLLLLRAGRGEPGGRRSLEDELLPDRGQSSALKASAPRTSPCPGSLRGARGAQRIPG